jgi:hypothetical protein
MARRVLTALGIVAGLMVAALVAGAAYSALKAPLSTTPNSNLNPENCSPGPCANVRGFTLWISKVRVQNDLVRMTVKFQNSSAATHVAPEDLQLIDAGRRTSIPVTNATGCNTFARHEFSGGAVFGPIDICFRVSNSTPPFIFHWTPDLGTFCCEQDITIWPT